MMRVRIADQIWVLLRAGREPPKRADGGALTRHSPSEPEARNLLARLVGAGVRLGDVLREVSPPGRDFSHATAADLRSELARLIGRGLIAVYIDKVQPVAVLLEPKADHAPATGNPTSARTKDAWIRIELVQREAPEKGVRPVKREAFRIRMEGEEDYYGQLDDQGRAYVPNIAAGSWQITFLDLDASDWQPLR